MKVAKRFTLKDAEELYLVPHWSGGFFRVGEKGDLEVTPLGPKGPAASLLEIVEALRDEGRPLPLVLRFPQILGARVRDLNEAFLEAMAKYGYQGTYRGVYPVKVNQRRLVLETVARAGRPYHLGPRRGASPSSPSSWPRTSPRRPSSPPTASRTTTSSASPSWGGSLAATW